MVNWSAESTDSGGQIPDDPAPAESHAPGSTAKLHPLLPIGAEFATQGGRKNPTAISRE